MSRHSGGIFPPPPRRAPPASVWSSAAGAASVAATVAAVAAARAGRTTGPAGLARDRYKSGEVSDSADSFDTARPLQGRTIGHRIRRFQQHVANSELPEPDESRCPPPICNGLHLGLGTAIVP